MKKLLLTNLLVLACFVCSMAQTAYNETFATMPTDPTWNGGTTYSISIMSSKLNVVMNDSSGPEQLAGCPCPAANWANLTMNFTYSINMKWNRTITLDIDNTGNAEMTLNVQVQDVNGKYTDNVNVNVPAGFSGNRTLNYTNKFRNYYGSVAQQGLVDSTQINQINIQPVGGTWGAAPWNKKFKGNFTIDNFMVGGAVLGTNIATSVANAQLFPNPATDAATLKLELNSVSDVKVTLTDMMGREIAVIRKDNVSSLEESFDVSAFAKGLYTVNYFINGAPAKSELLMVK